MKNNLKTLLALLFVFVITMSFVACGSKKTTDTSETNDKESVEVDKFQQFEEGLTDKQIEFEVNEKAASMVGAKEGRGYLFNDGSHVELYLFDKSTDAYKKAVKNNEILVESFDITMDVVFNDDICIYYSDDVTNKTDIEAVFEALK